MQVTWLCNDFLSLYFKQMTVLPNRFFKMFSFNVNPPTNTCGKKINDALGDYSKRFELRVQPLITIFLASNE